MDTQTKPELFEPAHPPMVVLDTDDSIRIDVGIFSSKNYALSSYSKGYERIVGVYIRTSDIDLESFLGNAEKLESRFLDGEDPREFRNRIISQVRRMRPLRDEEMSNGKYFVLEYDPIVKDQVYEVIRGL